MRHLILSTLAVCFFVVGSGPAVYASKDVTDIQNNNSKQWGKKLAVGIPVTAVVIAAIYFGASSFSSDQKPPVVSTGESGIVKKFTIIGRLHKEREVVYLYPGPSRNTSLSCPLDARFRCMYDISNLGAIIYNPQRQSYKTLWIKPKECYFISPHADPRQEIQEESKVIDGYSVTFVPILKEEFIALENNVRARNKKEADMKLRDDFDNECE